MLGVGSGIGGVSSSKRMNMSSCRHHALADPARWGPCEELQGEQPAITPRVTVNWADEGMTMAAASPAYIMAVPDSQGEQPAIMPKATSRADEGVTMVASPAYIPAVPDTGPFEKPKPRRGPLASSPILPRSAAWPVVLEGITAAASAAALVSDGPSNKIVQIMLVRGLTCAHYDKLRFSSVHLMMTFVILCGSPSMAAGAPPQRKASRRSTKSYLCLAAQGLARGRR